MHDFSSPVVMGILNTTPDSFSDGGKLYTTGSLKPDIDLALQRALQMEAEGAAIIDVGGESTRPGAAAVSIEEELDRTIPLIEKLKHASGICISIDTNKAQVMTEAINAGATLINDVCALQNPGALEAASTAAKSNTELLICLMHMQGKPQTMQENPQYDDVVEDVTRFLADRMGACEQAGIDKGQLLVDPGFGFGKTLEHNLDLLVGLERLNQLGCPLLVGLSRKRMVGAITGCEDPEDRLAGSLALAWACLQRGAKILRVHDVKETVHLVKVFEAVEQR